MAKCTACNGDGCSSCGNHGYISDCQATEHWGDIDGKRYPLVLDPGSRTHRFKPNRIVRDMTDAAYDGRKYDLNAVARKFGYGEYTREELLEFYLLIGYTMDGLSELSFFKKLEMDSCAWKDLVEKEENHA